MSNEQIRLKIGNADVLVCFSSCESTNVKESVARILTGSYEEKLETKLFNVS